MSYRTRDQALVESVRVVYGRAWAAEAVTGVACTV
jgi:hypothetical protein